MKKNAYWKELITIGLPITLQSILQASYSLVDQIMVGTLGSISIAGSGLVAKFSSMVTFTISSVAVAASILIAQYFGKKDISGIRKSFSYCTAIAGIVGVLFAGVSFAGSEGIMRLYTHDVAAVVEAARYLRVIAISFLPMTVTLMLSAYLRSIACSKYPMYASVLSLLVNMVGNYILIFGCFGMPKLGLLGAGIGTLIARMLEAIVLVLCYEKEKMRDKISRVQKHGVDFSFLKQVIFIIFPVLLNEFSWSVGENIYAAIYGRMGTRALAAITLTNPLQGMFIGMFSGVSSAAVVMVGKRIGNGKQEEAYSLSKYLLKVGAVGSALIGVVLAALIPFYVKLFRIEAEVAYDTRCIVYVLAVLLFVKVSNMILAGGILRAGGKTKLTLIIDLIGTWVFGVPLGLFAAFVCKMPVYFVYLTLSMEEVVRLLIGMVCFRQKGWICNIAGTYADPAETIEKPATVFATSSDNRKVYD